MREVDWIEFDALVSLSLDGSLSDSERAELAKRIQTSAEHRQRYLELAALHGSLAWLAPNLPATSSRIVRRSLARSADSSRMRRWSFLLLSSACVLWLSVWLGPRMSNRSEVAPTFGVVEELAGRGVVTKDGEHVGELAVGDKLLPGQTLHMDADEGYAVVKLQGGPHLELTGRTTIRLASWKPNSDAPQAFVSQGVVRATGSKSSQPIVLETPHARVEIQNTVLTCVVSSDATRMENEEGQAQVVRTADNRALALPSGSYSIANADAMEDLVSFRIVKRGDVPRIHVRLAGSALALSLRGDKLATALRNKVTFWNTVNAAEVGSLTLENFLARWLAFSKDGRQLGLADAEGNVEVWNIDEKRRTHHWPAAGPVSRLALHPDGQTLALIDEDPQRKEDRIRLLSLQGLPTRNLKCRDVTAIAFSPDGRVLAAGTESGEVRLWNLAEESMTRLSSTWRRKNPIRSLVFSADGRKIACLHASHVVQVWERELASVVQEVPPLGRQVRELQFIDGNRRLALGTLDGVLTIWDLLAGEEAESQRLDIRSILALRYEAAAQELTVISGSGFIHRWSVQPRGSD